MAIAQCQTLSQQLHYRKRKASRRGRGNLDQILTASDQVARTALMICALKTIVGSPAVMIENPFVVFAQARGCLSKSATGQDGIGEFLSVLLSASASHRSGAMEKHNGGMGSAGGR